MKDPLVFALRVIYVGFFLVGLSLPGFFNIPGKLDDATKTYLELVGIICICTSFVLVGIHVAIHEIKKEIRKLKS
jgi:hypothetical protein